MSSFSSFPWLLCVMNWQSPFQLLTWKKPQPVFILNNILFTAPADNQPCYGHTAGLADFAALCHLFCREINFWSYYRYFLRVFFFQGELLVWIFLLVLIATAFPYAILSVYFGLLLEGIVPKEGWSPIKTRCRKMINRDKETGYFEGRTPQELTKTAADFLNLMQSFEFLK